MSKHVFITGGTGYLGTRFIKLLLNRGYFVKALVRKGSENKLPAGCNYVIADPFDAPGFVHSIEPGSIFVQLLGVSHPGPRKKDMFYKIDYASALASVAAATQFQCKHFIYISVAQTPTAVMKDYQLCRAKCEALIKQANLNATILRPWYIIGPGHYWPLIFLPLFKLMELFPATSGKAKALRFVYLKQMLSVLMKVVETVPPEGIKFIEIAEIRKQ